MTHSTQAIFSHDLLRLRKQQTQQAFKQVNYLAKDMEVSLIRRIKPRTVNNIPLRIMVFGAPAGSLLRYLETSLPNGSNVDYDPAFESADFCEETLQLDESSYDIIIDCFVFHWFNNPISYLSKVSRALKPGGMYLSAYLGGSTLQELRAALIQTDLEIYGGAFTRVSPMIKPESATRLMQVAGLSDPIVDHEEAIVNYPSAHSLIKDLRRMGESNAFIEQSKTPRTLYKNYINNLESHYQTIAANDAGEVCATFDFVFMTGWGK